MTTAVNPTPPPRLKQKLVICFLPLGRETAGGLQKQRGLHLRFSGETIRGWSPLLQMAVLFSTCYLPSPGSPCC